MRPSRTRQGTVLTAALALAALLSTACGQLTIRTWVKLVESESSGSVTIGENPPFPFDRIQGGFLAVVRLDTSKITPIRGTMALDDVRLAGSEPQLVGALCVWRNPKKTSAGPLTIDVLGTGPSSADIVLNLRAIARISERSGPIEISQAASFDLGGDEGGAMALAPLLEAERTGSADGLFETRAAFVGETTLAGFPVRFDLDLLITNEGTPPVFSADLLAFCNRWFKQQGREIFWSVNPKGSYLTAEDTDTPALPLVIDLDHVNARPGDRLRLRHVGEFAENPQFKDGGRTGLTGVFSASDRIGPDSDRRRVVGAREAGPNVVTPPVTRCILIAICPAVPTDIPEDFRIDPMVDVVVPAGATHLVVAALPPRALSYQNNSGFGFGVTLENRGR
jgi:hypothetical protein